MLEPDYRFSTNNSKLKKDRIVSFNLLPITHCPMAGVCKDYCYATVGNQSLKVSVTRREKAFVATQQPDFLHRMKREVERAVKRGVIAIRVHDSGDFYSYKYLEAWLEISRDFSDTKFYAYTKMIRLIKRAYRAKKVPNNFRFIQSYGGLEDKYIDKKRHYSKIFPSLEELLASGYADASVSDIPAAFGESLKIGLIAHGAKKNKFKVS